MVHLCVARQELGLLQELRRVQLANHLEDVVDWWFTNRDERTPYELCAITFPHSFWHLVGGAQRPRTDTPFHMLQFFHQIAAARITSGK